MVNLVFRSFIVLALLFGLVFAIGMMALVATGLPIWLAVPFAVIVVALQYLLGPFILQWIYKIRWVEPAQLDPQLAAFIARACQERNIPQPRLGVIDDGNPNAFTFGHYPGNARLVVTRGLLQMLNPQEVQAVVGHEMGHIAHWDFVVMTIAAVVPLLLYTLYIATRLSGRSRKGGGYIALIGFVSYIAYVVSQFIVLLLSRVREYYADRFAGEVTGNPDALATGLVKIAYGLARAPEAGEAKNDVRMQAARSFGVFDPKVARVLALTGAGSGNLSSAAMEDAMKWDLWNPWAGWYELSSSHPLPAKRIKALEKQSEAMGRVSSFSFHAVQPESYWDEFLVDFAVNQMAWIGFVFGLAIAAVGALVFQLPLAGIGAGLLAWAIAWWLQRRFIYPPDLSPEQNVKELVGQVKVSKVRAVPGTLRGRIIGRGVPGLFYSEDLVMQDLTGFVVLDYRQPWRLFEFLFGLLRAEKFIGQTGVAKGWFRRVPQPVFELRELALADGKKAVSWVYPLEQFCVYALMVLGVLMLIGQVALMLVR